MSLRLIPEPPQIGSTDAFSTSDIFEARETGERLANIVANLEGHSVILFDGPWGTGKSVFVQQWAGLLRRRGHPVVYFDAFAHDHLDDAFFPLLGQLLRARSTADPPLARARKKLIEKAAPLVRTIPVLLADAAIRSATAGTLARKDVADAWETSKAQSADRVQAMIDECLSHIDDHAACIQQFRHELNKAVSAVGDDEGKLPLVFIVDELDRCRPTYALSVLERIKHIFAADGVCFVLVTHLTELSKMVERAYGLLDADSYLKKFYHRRFSFEKLLLRGSEKLRRRYIDHLAKGFNIERDPDSFATITLDNLTRIYNVPLRVQERMMLSFALCHSAIPSTGRHTPEAQFQLGIAPGLAVMRHLDQRLFGLASAQSLRFRDANEFLRIQAWEDISPDGKRRVEHWWRMASLDGFSDLPDEKKPQGLDPWNLQACRKLLADTCSIIDLVRS